MALSSNTACCALSFTVGRDRVSSELLVHVEEVRREIVAKVRVLGYVPINQGISRRTLALRPLLLSLLSSSVRGSHIELELLELMVVLLEILVEEISKRRVTCKSRAYHIT